MPYYPYFSWVKPPYAIEGDQLRLLEESVTVPSAETNAIAEAARQNQMVVSIGVNERDGGTIYNTQLLFDADGTLLQRRRKITPPITSGWSGDRVTLPVCARSTAPSAASVSSPAGSTSSHWRDTP